MMAVQRHVKTRGAPIVRQLADVVMNADRPVKPVNAIRPFVGAVRA